MNPANQTTTPTAPYSPGRCPSSEQVLRLRTLATFALHQLLTAERHADDWDTFVTAATALAARARQFDLELIAAWRRDNLDAATGRS